jgi:voltage-gated potassium channel
MRHWRESLVEWLSSPTGPQRQFRHGLMMFALTSVTGVLAYMVLCGWSFGDSLYMLIITISSVGYGEIGPHTKLDRFVSSYVIIVGIMSAAYTFGGLLQMMSEGQIRRIVTRQMQSNAIASLTGHSIICGYGRMGAMICEDLQRHGSPFVLVELDVERAAKADFAGCLTICGDATDETVLEQAGIHAAKSLVCVLPSDSDTARAEKLSTEKKLQQAGADRVVAPQVIGAQRICNLLTRPTTVEILELVTGRQSVDLEMNEVLVPPGSWICNKTLGEVDVRKKSGVVVLAIKRHDGALLVTPDADVPIHEKDMIVIIGRRENIDSFRKQFVK